MKRKAFIISSLTVMFCFFYFTCVGQTSIHDIIFSLDFQENTTGNYVESEWKSDWNNPSWANKSLGYGVIESENSGNKYLKIQFEEDHFFLDKGGAQWHCIFEKGYDELYLTYKVKFSSGFGENDYCGKLPGLSGGTSNGAGYLPDGTDGWSARYMFHSTRISFYLYHPEIYKNSYYNDPEPIEGKKYYGDGVNLDGELETDKWYTITQRIVMNTVGSNNGLVEGYINGRLVAQRGNLMFRTIDGLKIDRIYFSNFFGGSGIPAKQLEYICFDDFYVYTFNENTDVVKGNTLSESGRVITEPSSAEVTESPVILAPDLNSCIFQNSDSVKLEWSDNSDNESGFEVYRSLNNTDNFQLIHTTLMNANQFVDVLSDSSICYYKIRAISNDIYSDFSDIVGPEYDIDNSLPVPNFIVANAIGHDRIQLNWKTNDVDITTVLIENAQEQNGTFSLLACLEANINEYVHSGMTKNTSQFYRIIYLKDNKISQPSSVVSATTIGWNVDYVPNIPTELLLEEQLNEGVRIEWDDNSTVESYYVIERAVDTNSTFQEIVKVLPNTVSYDDKSVLTAGTYYYRIKGVNHIGSSDYSDVASISVNSISEEPAISPLQLNNASVSIDEMLSPGNLIIDLSSIAQVNDGVSVHYEITKGNTQKTFAIDASNLVVSDSGIIDYEYKKEYNLGISITNVDNLMDFDTAQVTINIIDVNEAPSIVNNHFELFADYQKNDLIGNIGAYDQDFDQILYYNIINGNTDELFTIDNFGNLSLAKDLAEVDSSSFNSGYTITVQVMDNGIESLSFQKDINIVFIDNNSPMDIQLKAKPLDKQRAALEWDCEINNDLDNYVVERCAGSGFSVVASLNADQNIYFDENIQVGTSCRYRIMGKTKDSVTCYSNVAYVYSTNNENFHGRVNRGLLAYYEFNNGKGEIIEDKSGTGESLDLFIENPKNVKWEKTGGLTIENNTIIRSERIADKLINGCKSSNEITMEAWIQPSKLDQYGPARIMTISRDNNSRGATIGQGQDYEKATNGFEYSARLNTENTDENGLPDFVMNTGLKSAGLHHLIYTRDSEGYEKFYLNGQLIEIGHRPKDFTTWSDDYYFAVGNEITQNRPWYGTIHLAAVYNIALNEEQVSNNYIAGVESNVKLVSNVSSIENEMNISAFPNPFTDFLKIRFNDSSFVPYKVEVFDIQGRVVKSREIRNNTNDDVTFNLSSIKKGLYIVNVHNLSTHELKTLKVLKK